MEQEVDNGGTHCSFVSIPMMKEVASNYRIQLPQENKEWKIYMTL